MAPKTTHISRCLSDISASYINPREHPAPDRFEVPDQFLFSFPPFPSTMRKLYPIAFHGMKNRTDRTLDASERCPSYDLFHPLVYRRFISAPKGREFNVARTSDNDGRLSIFSGKNRDRHYCGTLSRMISSGRVWRTVFQLPLRRRGGGGEEEVENL